MILYTGFNGEVYKKLMVNYTTITCLCFLDNYMPSLNVRFWMAKGKVLAEMVDIGARVADDKKQRVSYIIISMNKVLRLLIIRSHSNPYFLWGYFRIKTLANLRLFFNVCK